MKENNLQNKVINAAKWASITEIVGKLITPITNMILARILLPSAFGVVATVNMIISFADMFTDAGFQKYLIQHEFENKDDIYSNATVAFWTNFAISIILWGIIVLFRKQISILVGNPGLGDVIAIASFQLPLTSFSSIQMAIYRRNFDFKTLFSVRTISAFVPFIVTVPLAFLQLGYWALIIGTLITQLLNACILTIKSEWRPKFFYSVELLKKMIAFSFWSLIEAISIWLSTWIDIFIIGSSLNQYYLGIYKTSTAMVTSIMSLIISSTVPILFSTLSRLQNDNNKFNHTFLKFQRLISVFAFPLGIGLYLYRDLATEIMLGSQWNEASDIVGIWGLTSVIVFIFVNYCGEVYRAKGRPGISFLAQLLHLVVLIPTCKISLKYGFWTFIYARSLTRVQFVLVNFVLMKLLIGMPSLKMIKNVLPSAFSALAMGALGFFLQKVSSKITWSFISIIICIVFYFSILFLFKNTRNELSSISKKILPKNKKNKLLKL